MTDLLVAFALITGADSDVRPSLSAMQAISLKFEIMDPREQAYLFVKEKEFDDDLAIVRKRYEELADAPPAFDVNRFPTRGVIIDLLSENEKWRCYLDDRKDLFPTDGWQFAEAIGEAAAIWQIYDLLRDARCEYYYITVRRAALKRLRDELGCDAYYNGALPPHIPVWYSHVIGG